MSQTRAMQMMTWSQQLVTVEQLTEADVSHVVDNIGAVCPGYNHV